MTVIYAPPPPIKANPAKAGDAKPWVYRQSNDHDCQAAEDKKLVFIGWLLTFKFGFTSAEPVQVGEAKRIKAMFRNFKVLLAVLAMLVIMGSAYAFAAQNILPTSIVAGDSKVGVSGVTISHVDYKTSMVGSDIFLDSVVFDTAGAISTTVIKVQLDASDPTWVTCIATETTISPWTCTPTASTLLMNNVDQLRVTANDVDTVISH